ncbi:MAG: 3-deoxy-7-phosphoheptulonate synthase [Pseudomonadota bacterium]|jgi:3-deoxy-7-phosphoheptulonate synthase
MIITVSQEATEAQVAAISAQLRGFGATVSSVTTQAGRYIVALGGKEFDIRAVGHLPGVSDAHYVRDAYQLVSRQWKVKPTVIDLGDGISIGGGGHQIIAGPCSIEGEEQVKADVVRLKSLGVKIMRGGVFKPRSSPYSFRGLGLPGLTMWSHHAREHGIKIITEVLDASQIEEMYPYVDIFQVGARNSQNFTLLDALGRIDKPVLLKRGMSGTLEELLQSAEYIFSNGNEKIMLCERGIRTFEKAYRNVLDLNAVPYLKDKSHLPVVVDPSHGVGVRKYVAQMALAGVVAGADGTLLEVHDRPEEAKSDAAQTLSFSDAEELLNRMRGIVAGK